MSLKEIPGSSWCLLEPAQRIPLHLACWMLAPLDVIAPLARVFTKTLRVCHRLEGHIDMCPLQYVLLHSMVSFNVICFLISQWPKALGKCFVLHLACRTKVSLQIIQYLVTKWPGALKRKGEDGLPLHYACHSCANLPTIDFLIQAWLELLQVPNERELLPVHVACQCRSEHAEVSAWSTYIRAPSLAVATSGHRCSNYLIIAESPPPPPVVILQSLVQAWLATVCKLDGEDFLPLHHLCCCDDALLLDMQALVEAWPDSLQGVTPKRGVLSLHLICQHMLSNRRDSICLIDLYPLAAKGKTNRVYCHCTLPV